MLRSISDEIRLLLRRDARGDTQRLLERLATCHALASSLLDACAAPDPSLIGSHRSQYDDVGHLELEGIAAWPWRSASGYDGLSVLFWEPLSARWNVWSEARPRSQSGAFQPAQRYFAPGPWDGAGSPNQLSHSAVRLLHARRNRQFRLSSSSSSRALITNPSRGLPSGLTVHTEVASLRTLAATTHSIGLKDPDPLAGVVLVEPASWGARRFDPIRQTFEWTVRDASEQSIRLELAHDDQNQPAIEFLETCPVGELKGARIVARLIPEPTDFSLHPYALHYRNGNRVNLALDTLKQVPAQVPSPSTMEEVEWDPEDGATTTSSGSHAIDGLLTEVVDVLLAMAERGITGTPDNLVNSLRAQASRASQLQLDLLASTLRTLLGKPLTAASLLRCAHVTQVHREASQALRWPEEFAELARQEPHPGNPGP
jgi:hypothetical protein